MKTVINTKYVKNILASGLMLFAASSILAQEEEESTPSFTLSGSIDAYYRANLNGDNSTSGGVPNAAPGSSFANLPGFALGMANVIASYEGEKVGFVADLVFGPRGTDAIFASPIYSATGKADFALSDDFSLMLAVMNRTDITELNLDGKYAYGAQFGYSGQYLNLLMDNGAYEIDYTGGFDVSEDFFLGLNAAYFDGGDNAAGFAGVALYPQLATSEDFTIGLRGEYFTELNGNFGAIGTGVDDSSVFAVTLTGSYSVDNLTIKPELRLDSSSDESGYFLDSDLVAQKSLSSIVIAAIYSF